MTRTRTVALIGGFVSAAAIAATIISAGQIRPALLSAYQYPTSSGVSLEEASSLTLTYLFAIAGTGLLVALAFLAVRPLERSRFGWWSAAALTTLGFAVAAYNVTQLEIPPAVRIAFFLPPLAGAVWLVVSRRDSRE
ncbi:MULTISPECIES: hypothetical protein [unclassified Brevibacterium]|uniref:hypothetical protein n=1 Tax=unclassified Brevibacterium TaxID=2614124 RepID=UPI0010F8346E|nr:MULTISPECIES: hypothetical protein [unclassified Brevibacterium]MCM1010963.1 hypothetical protein [Brevibacterium sp. XM4083]